MSQDSDNKLLENKIKVVTKKKPSVSQLISLKFAFNISKFVKSGNQKELEKIQKIVKSVNSQETEISKFSDEEFPQKTKELIDKLNKIASDAGYQIVDHNLVLHVKKI